MPLSVGIDYRPAILQSAGIGRAVRELVRHLAGIDVNLHLFGHSLARARRSDPVPEGCQLHRLPIPGRSLPTLARFGLDAARLGGRASVFHWTDYIHPPVEHARTVLTIHDLAMVADDSFHGAATTEMLARCRRAARRSDAIICPTRATADMVREHFEEDEARIRVIPFGCDHVAVDPTSRAPRKEPYIVIVGTVEPRKNHRSLLDAWRELGDGRPTLVVLGKRGWECDSIATALQEEPGVCWIDGLDDAAVAHYVHHAIALAYPSKLEGFGFPPLEAMRLGTPVLAGDTPALREVLGDAARFCDPHDVSDIGRGLRELVENADLREELRERGAARSTRFSWQRCAEEHAQVYAAVQAGELAGCRP